MSERYIHVFESNVCDERLDGQFTFFYIVRYSSLALLPLFPFAQLVTTPTYSKVVISTFMMFHCLIMHTYMHAGGVRDYCSGKHGKFT